MQRELLNRLSPDHSLQDPENWPPVEDTLIKPEILTLYQQRKEAVIKYCRCEWTLKTIEEKFGFQRKDFLQLIKRCFKTTQDGEIVGFAALIPYRRISATKGKLRKLFDSYPELEEHVRKLYLGKRIKGQKPEYKMSIQDVHSQFKTKCCELGIGNGEYPFSTKNEAREPLRKYLKNLYQDNTEAAVAYREGSEARRNLSTSNVDSYLPAQAIRPYEVVQADAHRIDALMTIPVEDINGIVTPLLLERPWIILLIDRVSRAILGYYFSLSSEPSSNDLLECVARSLIPWKPKQITMDGIEYPEFGGLPSGIIPHCAWRVFDRIELDNAMAHTSPSAQERINQVTQCCINLGKSKQPETRAIVERFFKTLTSRVTHRLPSTTGSHPKDNRRRKPEEKAKQFKVTLTEIELLLDVVIARYNTTSSKSLQGNTPLTYIERCDAQRPSIIRTVMDQYRKSLPLFNRYYTATVRGGKNGRRPYVQFKHAIYRNEVLVASSSIIGTLITLEVNTRDVSSIRAFLPDGSTIGMLQAQGVWALKPHSLKTRAAISKLVNDNVIEPNSPDPVSAYYAFKYKQSHTSAKAASALTKSLKESGQMIVVSSDYDANDSKKSKSTSNAQESSWKPRRKNWITLDRTKRK